MLLCKLSNDNQKIVHRVLRKCWRPHIIAVLTGAGGNLSVGWIWHIGQTLDMPGSEFESMIREIFSLQQHRLPQ